MKNVPRFLQGQGATSVRVPNSVPNAGCRPFSWKALGNDAVLHKFTDSPPTVTETPPFELQKRIVPSSFRCTLPRKAFPSQYRRFLIRLQCKVRHLRPRLAKTLAAVVLARLFADDPPDRSVRQASDRILTSPSSSSSSSSSQFLQSCSVPPCRHLLAFLMSSIALC